MNDNATRASAMREQRARPRLRLITVFLGVLLLPIVTYVLGVYSVTGRDAGSAARLGLVALLVAGAGGCLIAAGAMASVARTAQADVPKAGAMPRA